MENPTVDEFGSRRSTVHAPNGAVATSQPLAAQAGLRTLRDGGNAFDAAVATAAALNVVEPTSTGLGGDVFMLYRDADGEVGAMRACGPAPESATQERVREAVASAGSTPRSSATASRTRSRVAPSGAGPQARIAPTSPSASRYSMKTSPPSPPPPR